MEYVVDKVYYHLKKVSTDEKPLDVGQELNIGDKYNDFFMYYDHLPANLTIDNLVNEFSIFTRELLLENVRISSYPEMPSREKCIWLIPNDDLLVQRIIYWTKEFKEDCRIFKVSCTGNVHMADSLFIQKYQGCFSDIVENAHKYWQGVIEGENKLSSEILFTGHLMVLEECELQHTLIKKM